MTQKQQLRNGLYAVVAVALLIGLLFTQVNKEELYKGLQTQLKHSGIHLDANDLSLSLMYSGSIRLDGAHMKSEAFEFDADHLFIDLDLPALLTGKAIPQALYLQFADINIIQEDQNPWAKLLEMDGLKLKRIDVSQSEIHFEQQHLTLEKVDLDIRDIGKNKNPRMELRAHIGDGRIDAHGYLHFKHGKLSKGFGRLRLFDIPTDSWLKGTSLKTINGSITSHINQDKSWQSFGHLSIQGELKDNVELRAKLVGSNGTFLAIDEMVLQHQSIGALQFSGQCIKKESCDFTVQSEQINASPLLQVMQVKGETDLKINNFQAHIASDNGQWFTSAQAIWADFEYKQLVNHKEKSITIPSAKLEAQNFIWKDSSSWQLNHLNLFKPESKEADIEITAINYEQGTLNLPISINHSNFWLPIAQILSQATTSVEGAGNINGHINLEFFDKDLTYADITLDASNADLRIDTMLKPQGIPLLVNGQLKWDEERLPALAALDLKLGKSTFQLRHESTNWHFSNMEINFDQLKEVGIRLPQSWQSWHGYILGSTTLSSPAKNIIIQAADVDLIQFGKDRHFVDGQIQTDGQHWEVQNLRWTQDKNFAEFFSGKNNQFDIQAKSLDAQALAMLQSLPFSAYGKLEAEALRLPFGTLTQVNTHYKSSPDSLSLNTFTCNFYEGLLSSERIEVSPENNFVSMQGTIQVGGIRLNNWLWLHKQFGTHLEAKIYATLNLEGHFNNKQQLVHWKGDGEVSVYNGLWLFHDKNVKADKLNLTLRKRKEFNATFDIKDGRHKGEGHFRIDEKQTVSGQLHWLDTTYQLTKSWPKFRIEEVVSTP